MIPGVPGVDTVTRAPAATARFVAHPRTGDKAPVVVGLFALLIGLRTWQAGKLPDAHELVVDGAMAGGLVVVSDFVPELVTWGLLVALLYWSLTNASALSDGVARFVRQIGG